MRPTPLPTQLGTEFAVHQARAMNVSERRLRAQDLERPFRGVRLARSTRENSIDAFARSRERERTLAQALGRGLSAGQFLSHRSAALLWGAPLPFRANPDLHASTVAPQRAPRIKGVTGHVFAKGRSEISALNGVSLTSPASTFVLLGQLTLPEIVAAGDYLVRSIDPGYGRRLAGEAPLTTILALEEAVSLGRWAGSRRLRQATSLIRVDSWSPRESMTRVTLVLAGLPEPELNVDLFDSHGGFLGCVDMVYPQYRVAIEYQGQQHAATFAEDLERIEALRAEGWIVIQVSKVLARNSDTLVARVANALRSRGWRPA
ncbi:MAG: DUF559 domain-containing protein [Actinobacteria bacterium]|nr:DUF559 domain-containing protein [Actinomycetota bacterium]